MLGDAFPNCTLDVDVGLSPTGSPKDRLGEDSGPIGVPGLFPAPGLLPVLPLLFKPLNEFQNSSVLLIVSFLA